MNTSFSSPEVKDLYLKAGNIEFNVLLRLEGIDALAHVLPLAFQDPNGDFPPHDTILSYCAVISREVEAVKKDVERITEMIKEC